MYGTEWSALGIYNTVILKWKWKWKPKGKGLGFRVSREKESQGKWREQIMERADGNLTGLSQLKKGGRSSLVKFPSIHRREAPLPPLHY